MYADICVISQIKVTLVRKYDHAMSNVISPMYALAILGSASFLIPVGGGERIGFIMTIVLGMIFGMSLVESHAAQSGNLPGPIIHNFIIYVYVLWYKKII